MNVLVSGVMEKGAAATKLDRASVYVTYLVIVWKLPVVEVNSAKTWVCRATTEYRIFIAPITAKLTQNIRFLQDFQEPKTVPADFVTRNCE